MSEMSHDKYIKSIFGRIENVKTFLGYCLPDLAKHLDVYSIESQPTEKVVPHSGESIYLDFAVNCSIQGKNTKVYILFEHKSYPDKQIITQIVKYIMAIWLEDIKNNRSFTPIVPVVIYNGTTTWNIPTDTKDIYQDIPEELKEFIFRLKYILFDLNTLEDEKIKNIFLVNQYLGIGFLALKRILRGDKKEENLLELMRAISNLINLNWTDILQLPPDMAIFLKETILYIQYEYKAPPEKFKELLKKEPNMQSVVDLFIEEGMEKGELKAKKEAVIKLYTKKGFSPSEIAETLDLPIEFVEEALKEKGLLKRQ